MNRSKTARELHRSGYNCAQSVFMAFCESYGVSLEKAAEISLSFAGGMGGMRETCGALTGAFMVLGLAFPTQTPPTPAEKKAHYDMVCNFSERFRSENGTLLCRELLANGKKPCGELVENTAELLEVFLAEVKN